MRILIVNTDPYPGFLAWLYSSSPGLSEKGFEDQMLARNDTLFGLADFYSRNLRALGHEAWGIYADNPFMQRAWMRDYATRAVARRAAPGMAEFIDEAKRISSAGGRISARGLLRSLKRMYEVRRSWLYAIVQAQVAYYRPDIVIIQAVNRMSTLFLKSVKPLVRLIVGQFDDLIYARNQDWGVYDLAVSSFPNVVAQFRSLGIRCEDYKMGFESSVLDTIGPPGLPIDATFVGSVYGFHSARKELLEFLSERLERFEIWGKGVEKLPRRSPIRNRYRGEAWGVGMYRILQRSRITVNAHAEFNGPYANNMRLYEATGVGTLLVTDRKVNLGEMFEVGKEVLAYATPEECLDLIRYYLSHEEERAAIAKAGQERTLHEHTYRLRLVELMAIIGKYLRRGKQE